LKPTADKGGAAARFKYRNSLNQAKGFSKRFQLAADYSKLAADQADAVAQNNYGNCLRDGKNV
jgi:TPR repeat protein